MSTNDETIDVSRRNMGSLLGALAGVAGFAGLAGCANPSGAAGPERAASAAEGLSGGNVLWIDTIIGGSGTPQNLSSLVGSDASPSPQPVAIVGGYSVPGDGGGGVFYWSTTPKAHDGGTFIVPNATSVGTTGAGWQRLYSGPLNVKWFGAKGDGVATDDAAIQSVLDLFSAANANGQPTGVVTPASGAIYFPAGIYNITTPLVYVGTSGSTLHLIGDAAGQGGADATRPTATGTKLLWTGPSQPSGLPAAIMQMWGGNNVTVEHIGFDGNFVAQTCLWLHTNQNTVAQGVSGAASQFTILRDCQFIQIATAGSGAFADGNCACLMIGDIASTQQVSGVYSYHCTFLGNEASPAAAPFACVYVLNGFNTEDMHFEGFSMLGAQYGFYNPTAGNSFSFRTGGWGNIRTACISVGGQSEIVVDGCGCENNSPWNTAAFFSGGNEANCTIQNTEVVMNVSGVPNNVLFGTAGTLILEGNSIDGTGEEAIAITPNVQLWQPVITPGGQGNTAGALISRGNAWRMLAPSNPMLANCLSNIIDSGNNNVMVLALTNGYRVAVSSEGDVIQTIDPSAPSNNMLSHQYLLRPVRGDTGIVPRLGAPALATSFQGLATGLALNYIAEPRGSTTSFDAPLSAFPAGGYIPFAMALAPLTVVTGIVLQVLTPFSGAGLTSATISVGSSAVGVTGFLAASDVMSRPANFLYNARPVDAPGADAPVYISLLLTTTGGAASAGAVRVHVMTESCTNI